MLRLGLSLLLLLTLAAGSSLLRAQDPASRQKIEAALLTMPTQCGKPCFWDIRPGVDTLAQFQSFAAQLYPGLGDLATLVDGVESNGVGLYVAPIKEATLDAVVPYVYVRLRPESATTAGFTMNGITPAAVITEFGNPTQAYLLANRAQINKSNRFRLFLVYRPQAALYVMTGKFEGGKACLTLANAVTVTLYRFKDGADLDEALKEFLTPAKGTLPPSIAATTDKNAADFTAIAANPAAACISLR